MMRKSNRCRNETASFPKRLALKNRITKIARLMLSKPVCVAGTFSLGFADPELNWLKIRHFANSHSESLSAVPTIKRQHK